MAADKAAEQSDIAGSLAPVTRQQAVLMLEAAYLWMDMGKFDHARELLTGAAALMPKSEVPQLALGTLEFNQGRYDKALQGFRAAQRLAPKSALPRAHCGEALIFLNKSAEALKELNTSADTEPDTDGAAFAVELMVLLGVREFNAAKLDRAQQAFESAIKRNPKHPLAHAHLGQVLYAAGQTADAQAALKKAIQLDKDGDAGRFAKSTLDLMDSAEKPAGKPAKKRK